MSTQSPRPPDLLVVDASLLIDDVSKRDGGAARGVVEALAEVCFHFALSKPLRREYENLRKQMRTHILLSQVLARVYQKSEDLDEHLEPLPGGDLGSWDLVDDAHLLELSCAAARCPVVTSEPANCRAAPQVKRALAIDVLNTSDAWALARSRPPCPPQGRP